MYNNSLICSKCKKLKSINDFKKAKHNKSGIANICKNCFNMYQKEYRLNNKNSFKLYEKIRYNKHKNKRLELNKKYYENNKEKMKHKRDPLKTRAIAKRFYEKNKNKIREKERLKAKIDPEYYFKKNLKRTYNLSVDDYNKILNEQNYKCLICKDIPKYKLHVDHCHVSNKIRGLLCAKCNTALGKFNDNIETLKEAIKYLEKNYV